MRDLLTHGGLGALAGAGMALLVNLLLFPGQPFWFQLLFLSFAVVAGGHLLLQALLPKRRESSDPLFVPAWAIVTLLVMVLGTYLAEAVLPDVSHLALLLGEGVLFGGAIGWLLGDKVESMHAQFEVEARDPGRRLELAVPGRCPAAPAAARGGRDGRAGPG